MRYMNMRGSGFFRVFWCVDRYQSVTKRDIFAPCWNQAIELQFVLARREVMDSVLVYGHTGYIGHHVCDELSLRKIPWIRGLLVLKTKNNWKRD